MSVPAARLGMVAKGNFLAEFPSLLDYTEGPLRMEGEKMTWAQVVAGLKAGKPLTGDCSSFYTEDAKWNGCSDPNRMDFDGYGYTGTLLSNMPHIALAAGLEGDAIVFGAYPGLHVVWITESHATNPSIHVPPLNPDIAGHGAPGLSKSTLQALWSTVFPGQPITVCSLEPFLPVPPDPHHYLWFDDFVRPVAHGTSSERESVMHYDEQRGDQAKNHVSLIEIQENLQLLAQHLEGVMHAEDPRGLLYHRAWRLNELKIRAAGYKVV